MNIKSFFTFLLLFIFFSGNVFSASQNPKGKALESFTKKQYDWIFNSDLGEIETEYSDIFTTSRKAEIFSDMAKTAKVDTIRINANLNNTVSKIESLEEAIKIIDDDISEALSDIKDTNINIISARKTIETNTKKIEIIQQKLKKNRDILLEYLDFLYKKQNTAYNEGKIDNLKSILLNNGDIGDLVNDLYFSSLVQIAGQKLIANHKRYISELYLKKVELEREKNSLSLFRKGLIISQKKLKEKRKFKEVLLEASKGRQKYYKKFLKKQIEIETNLKNIATKEKLRLAEIKKRIFEKYKCDLLDLSKNTKEVIELKEKGGRCYNINRMFYSEKKLKKDSKNLRNKDKNILAWPVSPHRGITAFFHDPEYRKFLGADHNAIDIKVGQGTPIKAPADGYVVYVKKPVDQGYSFVAIKHYDGYITVYGHLSEVFVDVYDYVEKGEIFSKSGGDYGTLGAGYITTGAHLHFEVFKDKKYIDPLDVLDLSYLDYKNLLPKYRLKYLFDFKKRKGYNYTSVNKNSKVFTLEGKDEIARQKFFLNKYANTAFNDWKIWVDESLSGNIDPSLSMCIGLAESSLGTNLTSKYNIGNVGNNDRGDRVGYATPKAGIAAMIRTLNNKYFKKINRLDLLSGAGRKASDLPSCKIKGEFCYATDTRYWHKNVVKCLSHMKGYIVPDDYNFRLSH